MFPYPDINFIFIGGVRVSVFVLLVMLGIGVGLVYLSRRARASGYSFNEQWGATAYGLYAGFALAHLTTLVFYEPHKLETHGPLLLLHFWHGLSSIGGFVGAVAGLAVYYRRPGKPALIQVALLVAPFAASCLTLASRFGGKVALAVSVAAIFWYYRSPRVPWLRRLELAFQGVTVAWVFGRAACTLIFDHPGSPTDFVLGFVYMDGVVRHNLGFYEALYTALVLLPVMLVMDHRGVRDGMILATLALLYGPARFLSGFLRATDLTHAEPRLLGLTPGQYGAALMTVVALGLLGWIRRQPAPHAKQRLPMAK